MSNPQTNTQPAGSHPIPGYPPISAEKDPFRKEIVKAHNGLQPSNQDEIKLLRERVQSLTYQRKLEALAEEKKTSLIKEAAPYVIAAAAFLSFAGFLTQAYNRDQVQISITYDVGTITGGILAGSAAMIAAVAYAKKSSGSDNNGTPSNSGGD